MLKVKLLSNNAKLPKRATNGSAGYDLYAAEETVVPANEKRIVKTDIVISIPSGYYAQIFPRSGLAAKNGITTLCGTIDSDYVGEVKVCLYNTSLTDYEIEVGDRIAQLVIMKCEQFDTVQVEELEETDRTGGFGSTGK